MPDPTAILPALWRASWQAGVLCLLVLALRWTLRDRLPAAWRCRLWGLVFLRLLLPAVPASPLSLFNWVPADPPVVDWPTLTVVVHETAATPLPPSDAAVPAPPPPARLPVWPAVVLDLWIGGAALLLTATLSAHVRFARRVRRFARPTPDAAADLWRSTGGRRRMVVTDAVSSPALFGLLRGRLLMPPALLARLSDDELRLVFRHELAHVRRRDLAVGWVTVLIRCVYWFHPLVWLAVAARRADAESACDDAVTATHDRLAYGRVLLAVAGGRRVPAVGMADARTDLRRRLARIAADRRPGRWSAAAAALLTAIVGCAALTGSKPSANVTRRYGNFWPPDYAGDLAGPSAQPTADQALAAAIRQAITPAAWGHDGVDVRPNGRQIVVTAPPDTQAQVQRLIDEKMVQVSIETRVLTLRPSQVRAAGLVVPDVGAIGTITNDQLTALVRAVARDIGASGLTAPRLTTFNGQRAVITVETQQAYVSELTPVLAPGAALFDPTVSTVPSLGLRLATRATVGPDHRSVDLTAHVELNRLTSMEPVTMTCTTGGHTITGTMQLPHVWTMTQDAAVHLPSGGVAWVRGRPAETYRVDGRAPRPMPTTAPAADDAADTFVAWKVTVLRQQPTRSPVATGPVPIASAAPLRAVGPHPVVPGTLYAAWPQGSTRAMPFRLDDPHGLLSVPPPAPGTPTPDGRGVAIPVPTDVAAATPLIARWPTEALTVPTSGR